MHFEASRAQAQGRFVIRNGLSRSPLAGQGEAHVSERIFITWLYVQSHTKLLYGLGSFPLAQKIKPEIVVCDVIVSCDLDRMSEKRLAISPIAQLAGSEQSIT